MNQYFFLYLLILINNNPINKSTTKKFRNNIFSSYGNFSVSKETNLGKKLIKYFETNSELKVCFSSNGKIEFKHTKTKFYGLCLMYKKYGSCKFYCDFLESVNETKFFSRGFIEFFNFTYIYSFLSLDELPLMNYEEESVLVLKKEIKTKETKDLKTEETEETVETVETIETVETEEIEKTKKTEETKETKETVETEKTKETEDMYSCYADGKLKLWE